VNSTVTMLLLFQLFQLRLTPYYLAGLTSVRWALNTFN